MVNLKWSSPELTRCVRINFVIKLYIHITVFEGTTRQWNMFTQRFRTPSFWVGCIWSSVSTSLDAISCLMLLDVCACFNIGTIDADFTLFSISRKNLLDLGLAEDCHWGIHLWTSRCNQKPPESYQAAVHCKTPWCGIHQICGFFNCVSGTCSSNPLSIIFCMNST